MALDHRKAGNQPGFFHAPPLQFVTEITPYRTLKDRDLASEGLFIAEGRLLVERMLASGCGLSSLLCTPDQAVRLEELARGRCPVIVRTEHEISAIVGFRFHRGVLGCGFRPAPVPVEALAGGAAGGGRRLLVVCPDLNDDANLGSIARSAAAFGAAGLLLGPRCCDAYSRRALRLSMGASLTMPIARFAGDDEALHALRAGRYSLLAAANRPEALALEEVRASARLAAAIGNEGSGLEPSWIAGCDALVRIPVSPGVDSLNAAVAAGILLYALTRSARA